MAGSFSDYLENAILNHIFKVSAFTQPTNLYVALFTVAPSDAGGGTEVSTSGTNYARKVANGWTTSSAGATENSAAITFNQATASWGTIVAFGIFDSLSGGNLLAWGTVTNKLIESGDTAEFASGALDITLD